MAPQNQAQNVVNNHLTHSYTVSTGGRRNTCRVTPYSLRHKYAQDGWYNDVLNYLPIKKKK